MLLDEHLNLDEVMDLIRLVGQFEIVRFEIKHTN